MKFLVSGGSGFIASHLCELLLELGHEIRVLDIKKPNQIPHLLEQIDFIHGDIRQIEDCQRAIKDTEIVVHMAALINVDDSIQNPLPFFETNVRGTMNLLEAVRHESSIDKFIMMSTAETFGTKKEGVMKETDFCDSRSPYAASKMAAEKYCLSFYHTYGWPEITIIRGFNTYGPRQSPNAKGAVTAKFITRMLRGEQPLIFGDGSQERDWVYVKDMVRGIVAASLTQGIGGEIINLASGKTISVSGIVSAIWNAGGLRVFPKYIDSRPGEVMRSCGDTSKAYRLLGWRAETPYHKGLKETIEYYRSQING